MEKLRGSGYFIIHNGMALWRIALETTFQRLTNFLASQFTQVESDGVEITYIITKATISVWN